MLLVLALFLAVSFSQLFPPNLQYTTSKVGSEWKVVPGTNGAATAMWEENRFINGWDKIHLTSNAQFSANDQAYAIGFLEGALLQKLTFDAWRTNLNGTNSNFPQKVTQFFVDNDAWTRKSVQQNPTIPYWIQVGLVLQQFDGLFDGYNQYAPAGQKIGKVDFLAYQAGAEVGDIFEATGSLTGPRAFDSHCSGLVKLVNNELYASHVTWSNFNGMLRTFKFMDTPFAPVRSMQYSGYPGNVPSGDDYYTTSSRLMIMETTNEIFNNDLYKDVSPHSVLYWIRVTVATRMSLTGEQWVNTFASYNSGTYNNQWMVVDYKLYTPGKPLLPGTLWVAEQIPGLVEMDDKTSVLNSTGYWASYNIPYFPMVYKSSGYPAYYAKYGDEYSYSMCARAQIFRRDHGNVHDLPSMKHLMRYNKFQTDPLSLQDACRGISARCDLNDPWINATTSLNGYAAFGGIDCKITSSGMIATDLSVAVSGPTWQSQPVFAWTEEWQYTPHWSQPTVFAFDFVDMKP